MLRCYSRLAAGLLGLAVVGCAASPPAHFYLLETMPGKPAPVCSGSDRETVAVGIGPVVVADYLNRPQIVSRVEANEIQLAEFHHWAGSLERELRRVLVHNIGLMLATDQIVVYPSRSVEGSDIKVAVHVLRFDGLLNQQATLTARWTVTGREHREAIASCQASFTQPVEGGRYRDLVAAMSRTVTQLSARIADELKRYVSYR